MIFYGYNFPYIVPSLLFLRISGGILISFLTRTYCSWRRITIMINSNGVIICGSVSAVTTNGRRVCGDCSTAKQRRLFFASRKKKQWIHNDGIMNKFSRGREREGGREPTASPFRHPPLDENFNYFSEKTNRVIRGKAECRH